MRITEEMALRSVRKNPCALFAMCFDWSRISVMSVAIDFIGLNVSNAEVDDFDVKLVLL